MDACLLLVGEGRVERFRVDAGLAQGFGELVAAADGGAVDDAASLLGFRPVGDEFLPRGRLEFDRVESDVGTVEARAEHDGIVESQCVGDFRHLPAGRGRGERGHYRARGQSGDEFADLEVVRAEVVAPLEYAVGLVHGDQVDACGLAEEQEIVCEQAFGCDVEDAESSAVGHGVDALALLRGHTAVDEGRGHSPGLQRLHLVSHEGAQWGHDEREMAFAHRGKLVADAFSTAGRHDGDQVAVVEDGVDGFELARAEGLVAVCLVELVERGLGPVAQFVFADASGVGFEDVDFHHVRVSFFRFGLGLCPPDTDQYITIL